MRRLLGLATIVAAAGCLGVACDSEMTVTPTTVGDVVSQRSTTSAPMNEIADWRSRMSGHTVSYRMELRCMCGAAGVWSVTERDGEVVDAQFLGDDVPGGDRPSLVLSEALRNASEADGQVLISDLTPTSIRLEVDVRVDAIDDEFVLHASDVIIADG